MSEIASTNAPSFFSREICLGEGDVLPVEYTLVELEGATGVLLKEARGSRLPATAPPVLTRAFEHIATVLRYELKYLKQMAGPLRFFHVQYAQQPTGTMRWKAQEVLLSLKGDHYIYGKWVALPADCQTAINAALSSWPQPQRMSP